MPMPFRGAFAARTLLSRFASSLRLLGAVLILAAPIAAEARNRTNEDLRRAIFGNFSDSQLRGYVNWAGSEDPELVSGVFISIGGYVVAGDGRSESFFTAQIFNTTPHAFCLRVRQAMVGGPFVGRQRLDNSGINMLVDPGGKAAIATYTAAPAVAGTPDFRADGIAWTPNFAAAEGSKCSSVEPPAVKMLATTQIGETGFSFMPDLLARLEGRPPPPAYKPGSNRASLALIEQMRRAGMSVDLTGATMGLEDLGQAVLGPMEVTAAASASMEELRALSWLQNNSGLNLCAVATAGISLSLEGNVQRTYAPAGGFYLPARSGRTLASFRGDRRPEQSQINPENPLNFNPSISVWDAPPGVASDAACAASPEAALAMQAVRIGGFSGNGRIRDLMR